MTVDSDYLSFPSILAEVIEERGREIPMSRAERGLTTSELASAIREAQAVLPQRAPVGEGT